MFRKLLAPRSVIIVLLTGGLVATGGYAWAQTTAQPAKVVACTFNRVLFLADSTTQKCSIGTRVELVTTAYQDPDVADLKSRVAALESEVDALQEKLSKVSYDPTGLNGHPTLKIDGANLQIVSGSGATAGTINGLGNLFIGYAENAANRAQTGSHNLVLGSEQSFTSYGGLIGGQANTLSGANASVFGASNTASGNGSSVSGGQSNTASGTQTSVSGGFFNTASVTQSSVSGGRANTASGIRSSVSGGFGNEAIGHVSSVSGGADNTASGQGSSILGGQSVTVNTNSGTSP